MGKKLSLEEVYNVFKKYGCELLSEEHNNSHELKKFKCRCGYIDYKSLSNFKAVPKCEMCSGKIKWNLEKAKKLFKDNDCELLEEVYHNSEVPMKYKCTCGKISYKRLMDMKLSQKCRECGNKKAGESNRLSQNYVKERLEEEGCELIGEYKTAKETIKFKCSCGNIDTIYFHNFLLGARCDNCKNEKIGNALRLDEELVRETFKEYGCLMIGTYVNSHTPIKYICECGNEADVIYHQFVNGTRCEECGKKKMINSKRNKHSKKVDEALLKEGYTPLEPYIMNKLPRLMKCPNGHEIRMQSNNFLTGHRCFECSNNKKKTIDEIKEFFEMQEWELISEEYEDAFAKLKCICNKGHENEMSWDNFRAGKRCRTCWLEYNKGENHPNWNPDLTQEERENGRIYTEYTEWRKKVYLRDNYTCQCCLESGKSLHAHHIQNYSQHKELRTELSNGITLCEDCHTEFHSIYGRKNNNIEQLVEFLVNKR